VWPRHCGLEDEIQKEGINPMNTATAVDKKQNLQDTFLNSVRRSKTPLTIFLVNGVKLQGVVSWFDNFCVLLRRDGQSQLVYKHAISTIMPAQPVQLYEPGLDSAD
jgi:host factor-I protein